MKKIVLIFSLILLTSFVVAVSVQLSEFQGTVNVPNGYTVTAGISENNMPYSAVVKDETYNIIIMCNDGDTISFRVNGKLADETGICKSYNVEPINVDLSIEFAPGNYTPFCGNNIIEPGEQCEENNFAGLTCQDFGYDTGDLKCVNCQRDLSGCSMPSCGDNTCNNDETCSTCPEDCGCSSGYYCSGGSCIKSTTNDDDDTSTSSGGGGGTPGTIYSSEDGLTTVTEMNDISEEENETIDLISSESQEATGPGMTGGVIGFVKSGVGMGLTFAVLVLIVGIGVMAFRKRKVSKTSKKE